MTTNIVTDIEGTLVGKLIPENVDALTAIAEYFAYLNAKDEISWREKARVEFLRDDHVRNLVLLKKLEHFRTAEEKELVDKTIADCLALTIRHNPEKPVVHIPTGTEYRGE